MRVEHEPLYAIVVDWNGTIVDDADRAWHATVVALEDGGLTDLTPNSLSEFRTAFRLPMEEFFVGLGVPDALITESVHLWNDVMMSTPTALAPGAAYFLQSAQDAGVPVIVVSGAREDVILQDCERLAIESHIARVYGTVHPKRDVLRRYAERGHIAYVGDTSYDVAEGLAAGATTFAVDFGYGNPEGLTDAVAVVSDLGQVVGFFDGVLR